MTYANFQGETWTYTLADILFDLVNHSTYHRGQVATLLRQLGKTPVSTDYVRFLDGGLAEPERTPEEIARLFAFNRWANARMLASVAECFGRRTTRGRSAGASRRFGTRSPTSTARTGSGSSVSAAARRGSCRAGQQAPTPEALREKWREVEEGWAALANGAEAGRMRETLAYRNFKGEDLSYRVGEVLVHVVNHSTYHRGQVATLMRQLGATPASTEYLMMLDEGA